MLNATWETDRQQILIVISNRMLVLGKPRCTSSQRKGTCKWNIRVRISRAKPKGTDWNDGAKEEMEMMGKPDARTAKDWNRPATAWSPGASASRAGSPMFKTLNEVHSIPLDHH